MKTSRRNFIKFSSLGGISILIGAKSAESSSSGMNFLETFGILVDISRCIGCRECEKACNLINQLPKPSKPFSDKSVFENKRRMTDSQYTVVNRFSPSEIGIPENNQTLYVKIQCMHCNDPACVSACIVGALKKEKTGAVTYDEGKCIGCRYCMVACPFQVPAYEYFNPFTPRVRKCTLCHPVISSGGKPACVKACPMEALTFGTREELIEIGVQRILSKPGKYVKQIYGEKEVGGTGYMYISPVPFTKLGFLSLPEKAPPRLTEKIQHGIFKHALIPVAVYTMLGIIMYTFKNRKNEQQANNNQNANKNT